MTVPLKTWMEDKTFKNQKTVTAFIELIREGQATGHIDPSIPPSTIVDFWAGMVTRSYAMWVFKKRKGDFLGDFGVRFNIFWNGIANKNNFIERMPERGIVSHGDENTKIQYRKKST